jgi:hypothetical protein
MTKKKTIDALLTQADEISKRLKEIESRISKLKMNIKEEANKAELSSVRKSLKQ